MPEITLVVTILRPPSPPSISPDDAAAAFGLVVESMVLGRENAAHLICRDDGSFECLSGLIGRRDFKKADTTAATPAQEE